jgi:hypothetical protein
MIDGALPQRAVLYDKPGQKNCIYATVYSDKQAERARRGCIAKHGQKANVRLALAKEAAR